jgi:hypothetical protein
MTIELSGPYRLVEDAYLRRRANDADDPRHVFYIAMLTCLTYEQYLNRVGDIKVVPVTHLSRAISGRDEIRYSRDKNRIRDGA